MFDHLSNQLVHTLRNISGKGRLTEKNIKDTLREIRKALLEADVVLPVVRNFISRVKESAQGKEINKSLTPGQELVKIVQCELVKAMGDKNNSLNLMTQPPAVILITGYQGAGKTTSVAKLGKYLREKQKKKILVVSTDIYRPAAIKQLEVLANNAGVDCFPSRVNQEPIDIVNQALSQSKLKFYDVLIVDTAAGCLNVDKVIIEEMIAICNAVKPVETLFVIDAMIGQDAANIARSFNESLPLTGIILTKVDSDARGGVALSVRYITDKPIKFMGVGEKVDALEPFYPNRLARRILGMGDMLALIEDIESKVDRNQAKKLTNKLEKGNAFALTDFLNQLKQMRNMGGITGIMSKLLGVGQLLDNVKFKIDDTVLVRMEAIINSMTNKERANPDIIKSSRKLRIAAGSGMRVQDVNLLLKQFDDMRQMMKKIKKIGIEKAIRNTKGMIPPGKTNG